MEKRTVRVQSYNCDTHSLVVTDLSLPGRSRIAASFLPLPLLTRLTTKGNNSSAVRGLSGLRQVMSQRRLDSQPTCGGAKPSRYWRERISLFALSLLVKR